MLGKVDWVGSETVLRDCLVQSKEKERKIVMINQRKGKEEKKKEKKEEIGNTLKNN